jgi:hypothetical protein
MESLFYLWVMNETQTPFPNMENTTPEFQFKLTGNPKTGWWLDWWIPIPTYRNGGLQGHFCKGGPMTLTEFRKAAKNENPYFVGF